MTLRIDAPPIPWPEVAISCVWFPQFPLRVGALGHPAWNGHPLVLGGGDGERKVVQLCSPEAEQAGIRPGLPLSEVIPLCREAIILQSNPVQIARVLDHISSRLQRVSPTIEVGNDRVFLDLGGLRQLYHADLGALESAIRAAIPPFLQPRIGVAGGKFTASIAASVAPPRGIQVVPAARTVEFLAPLPIDKLPLAPEMLQRLELLGLRAISDLAALPFTAVQAAFVLAGARAWRLANGHDDEPIIPHRFTPTVRSSLNLDDPLASVDAILAALNLLLIDTFHHPALQGRGIRQACLRALLANGESWQRVITFKEVLSRRDSTYLALKTRLELPGALPVAPVEELSLELMDLSGEAAKQHHLFSAHSRQLGQIAEAARQLRARYGYVPLYHATEVEPWSRLPERRWALVPCDL